MELRGEFETDRFGVTEKLKRVLSTLASDARLFRATKGDSKITNHPAVDPNGSGMDLEGHAHRSLDVACPERSTQSVLDRVGVFNDLAFRVERPDGDDGTKDLLLLNPAGEWFETGDDGGVQKVSLVKGFRKIRFISSKFDLSSCCVLFVFVMRCDEKTFIQSFNLLKGQRTTKMRDQKREREREREREMQTFFLGELNITQYLFKVLL